MRTATNHHPARADDAAIVAALTAHGDPSGGGNVMRIGIRNEAGAIYRAVETTGMGDFMGCVNALLDLGLTDELADSTSMREGMDAIFS